MARQSWLDTLASPVKLAFGVRSGLRSPRRLTVLSAVGEAPTAVFYALR